MSLPKPRIIYFNIRGRVEPIRLMFEELAEAYDDVRVNSLEEWQLMKPQTPFGALPLYEEGELKFAQSQAIYYHIARTRDLYADNESDRVQCDVGAAAISETNESLWKLFWEPDYRAKLASYVAGPFGESMAHLERWFTRDTPQPQYWVAERLSFVDFFAYGFLDEVDALLPAALDVRPALRNFHRQFETRPAISAYIKSGRRPAAFGFCIDGVKLDPRQARAAISNSSDHPL